MRKRLVIYSSCQGEALYFILRDKFPDAYDYQFFASYKVMQGAELPDGILEADVFLYQPFQNKRDVPERRKYETGPMLKHFAGRGVRSFGFPYLHFEGYHSDWCHDPLNEQTKTEQFPWGKFPYGMKAIMGLRGQKSADEILAMSKSDTFIPPAEIAARMENSISHLRRSEEQADVKITDWILANFRQKQLFHSVNHPVNAVLQRVFDPAMDFLGLPHVDLSGTAEYLGVHQPPIYPCVGQQARLEFTPMPRMNHLQVSYDSYIHEYASLGNTYSQPVSRPPAPAPPPAGAAPEEEFRSAVLEADCPAVMKAGRPYVARVNFRNDSPNPWYGPMSGKPEVKLGYHWLLRDVVQTWDGGRANLPGVLQPGQNTWLEVLVQAPEAPGNYVLQWDPVIEGRTWFSAKGCVFPPHPVTVEP